MLVSGESYKIGEILSNDIQIQIPDMQRDYCWALTISDNNGKSLVENFIEDLISQVNIEDDLQMGLLYAYESPKYHIQLCDGQQRLTTLYLTLAILYRMTNNPEILKKLILPNQSPIVPRLQYAIRESTLTFLTDLVREVFINDEGCRLITSEIKQEDWYFSEYNNDPSIQNILRATELIYNKLNFNESQESSSPSELSEFILNKITFLYFDMLNRTYGEEQFVVLNTTGKPLSITENIKPKLLGELDDFNSFENNKTELQYYADLWENWEQFFWQSRNKAHRAADKSLNEFFRWIFIIEKTKLNDSLKSSADDFNESQKALSSFKYNLLELSDNKRDLLNLIEKYFKALNLLKSDQKIKVRLLFNKEPLSQIQCFELLPLLSFVKEFEIENTADLNYTRLKNFLIRRAQDENVSKSSITTTIEAIRIPIALKSVRNVNFLDYKEYEDFVSLTLLNKCEIYKFETLKKETEKQSKIELAFWDAEKLSNCEGNIEYMFQVLGLNLENPNDEFPLNKFKKLIKIIRLTFEQHSDLMRRALLTFGNYYVWHGQTVTLESHRYSLGNTAKFYGNIANHGEQTKRLCLIKFLQKAIQEVDDLTEASISNWLTSQTEGFEEKDNSIYEKTRGALIADDNFMTKMRDKLFCVSYDENKSYALSGTKSIGEHSSRVIINQSENITEWQNITT